MNAAPLEWKTSIVRPGCLCRRHPLSPLSTGLSEGEGNRSNPLLPSVKDRKARQFGNLRFAAMLWEGGPAGCGALIPALLPYVSSPILPYAAARFPKR